MALQDFRPRDRVIQAVFWDGSAAAEEDVRLLVGLAGGRVAFAPGQGVRGLTLWLVGGKRRLPAPAAGASWLIRDGAAIAVMGPGTFAKVFEAAPGPPDAFPLAHIAEEGATACPACGVPVARWGVEPCVKPSDTRET